MDTTLKIEVKGSGYIVVDQDGAEYGPQVDTREEAKQVLADWKEYYGNH